jgi:hypothetical protein
MESGVSPALPVMEIACGWPASKCSTVPAFVSPSAVRIRLMLRPKNLVIEAIGVPSRLMLATGMTVNGSGESGAPPPVAWSRRS